MLLRTAFSLFKRIARSAASSQGTRAATIFANNYKLIYPYPELVKTIPTTSLAEIVRTKAPAILIEVGYHDNPEEAQWIRDNISAIAENLSTLIKYSKYLTKNQI